MDKKTVIITDFDKNDFFDESFYKDLLYLPTLMLKIRDEYYFTHPYKDLVPHSYTLKYKILDDFDIGYHDEVKRKLDMLLDIFSGLERNEKTLDIALKVMKNKLK